MGRLNDATGALRGLAFSLAWGFLLGVPSQVCSVELYRCTLNGRVEFRQTACPAGKQEKTEVVEQSGGMTPVVPTLRLEPLQEKRRTGRTPQVRSSKINEERCWKTEKRLERIEQRLRTGYKASQFGKLHRAQDEYEDYLERFCQ
ncbi:MAG: thioredoxin [Gammaproteobacteria bacterium]|nr:thioredoxin [Gammaproteobacteria bacterium]